MFWNAIRIPIKFHWGNFCKTLSLIGLRFPNEMKHSENDHEREYNAERRPSVYVALQFVVSNKTTKQPFCEEKFKMNISFKTDEL